MAEALDNTASIYAILHSQSPQTSLLKIESDSKQAATNIPVTLKAVGKTQFLSGSL